MSRYILQRIGQSILVVLGVTMIVFWLQHQLPGGPARAMLGAHATPTAIAHFNREYGLNEPLVDQYWHFLYLLLHGNLGFSYTLNLSVDTVLALDLPKTLLLVGVSFFIAVVIAVPIGVLQAVRRSGIIDNAITGASFVLYSMPSFWLGLILITIFAAKLHILPAEAPQGSTIGQVLSDPLGLVLPVTTLVLINFAMFSRYIRSSAIDTLAQDYIRVARSKGMSESAIVWRHVLRNSLTPIITLIGISLPWLFTAGLIVEQIFNYPGTGLLFYTAALHQDYPVELGVTLVVAIATVLGSLLADLAYAILDPRVRFGSNR